MKIRRHTKQNPQKRKLMNDFFRVAENNTAREVADLSGIEITTIHKMNKGATLNPKEKTCGLMRKFIREHQKPDQVLASGVDNTLSDFLKATRGMTVATISSLTGISQTGVQKIVSGTTINPRRHTLARMEKFLYGDKPRGEEITEPRIEPRIEPVAAPVREPITRLADTPNTELFKLVELTHDALTDPNISEFDRALLVYNHATTMVEKARELVKSAI